MSSHLQIIEALCRVIEELAVSGDFPPDVTGTVKVGN